MARTQAGYDHDRSGSTTGAWSSSEEIWGKVTRCIAGVCWLAD